MLSEFGGKHKRLLSPGFQGVLYVQSFFFLAYHSEMGLKAFWANLPLFVPHHWFVCTPAPSHAIMHCSLLPSSFSIISSVPVTSCKLVRWEGSWGWNLSAPSSPPSGQQAVVGKVMALCSSTLLDTVLKWSGAVVELKEVSLLSAFQVDGTRTAAEQVVWWGKGQVSVGTLHPFVASPQPPTQCKHFGLPPGGRPWIWSYA